MPQDQRELLTAFIFVKFSIFKALISKLFSIQRYTLAQNLLTNHTAYVNIPMVYTDGI